MSKNDITGDNIVSKGLSEQGRENWGNVFKVKAECGTCRLWDGSTHHRYGGCMRPGPVVIVKHRRETCGEWEKK